MKSLLILMFATLLIAQDNSLSIQGVLRQPSGKAVADGTYNLTFTFYTVEVGGTPIANGIKNQDIDIKDGLYNANVDITGIPFDAQYYIGIKVGTNPELAPRIKLTAAPYALSLRGLDNIFPSTGTVEIGTGLLLNNKGIIQHGGSAGDVSVNHMGLHNLYYQSPMTFVTNDAWFSFFADGGSNPNGGTPIAQIASDGTILSNSFRTFKMHYANSVKFIQGGEFNGSTGVTQVASESFVMYWEDGVHNGKYQIFFQNGLSMDPNTYTVTANTVDNDNLAVIYNKDWTSFKIYTYNLATSTLEASGKVSFIVIQN